MFLCKADKSLTVADAVNVSQSLFLERRLNRFVEGRLCAGPRSRVHTATGSTVSLLEFGFGIKKERKKETEHQHNEFKKVNVNAHAALCCSLPAHL